MYSVRITVTSIFTRMGLEPGRCRFLFPCYLRCTPYAAYKYQPPLGGLFFEYKTRSFYSSNRCLCIVLAFRIHHCESLEIIGRCCGGELAGKAYSVLRYGVRSILMNEKWVRSIQVEPLASRLEILCKVLCIRSTFTHEPTFLLRVSFMIAHCRHFLSCPSFS